MEQYECIRRNICSKSFQVGANAGQTISVSVDTAATASIGAFESTSTATALAAHAANSYSFLEILL